MNYDNIMHYGNMLVFYFKEKCLAPRTPSTEVLPGYLLFSETIVIRLRGKNRCKFPFKRTMSVNRQAEICIRQTDASLNACCCTT